MHTLSPRDISIMLKTLKIAEGFSLPLESVTQTIAILAKRRSGKSFLMRRLTEQLFRAGQQVVTVDPKGDQWGIRSAADGKGPGLPIVILGGERGDVPLESSGGELVAKLVVEQQVSILLDLSLFRKHEVATFMTAFLENLYRLKAREIYRTPMMLVIDEADAIAPQKPQKGEERMLGAAEDIVRRGGQRGIGCTLVTQRSAVLNKNVLTQAQMLVALRTIAPQDLAAMDAWIQVHGEPDQRKTLMESLPSLPVGDAWFWSPGWPTTDGIFKRVHVLPIETFDSGATPKPGMKPVEPKHIAEVDLEALKTDMAATIARAEADDPRKLREKIIQLERQIKIQNPKLETKTIEVPVIMKGEIKRLSEIASAMNRHMASFSSASSATEGIIHALLEKLNQVKGMAGQEQSFDSSKSSPHSVLMTPQHIAMKDPEDTPKRLIIPRGERRILTAIAKYPAGRTKVQLAILTGYAHNGGGFSNYLSSLRSKGFIHGPGDQIQITELGLSSLGPFEPLPTGLDLLEQWRRQLGRAERAALDTLVAAYPNSLTKEQVAEQSGYISGGGFNNALSRLRTLELIHGRGELKASDNLF